MNKKDIDKQKTEARIKFLNKYEEDWWRLVSKTSVDKLLSKKLVAYEFCKAIDKIK